MAARKRSNVQAAYESAKKPKSERPKSGSDAIEVGDKLPSISLQDQDQQPVDLSEVPGLLVLFAYPKASTPGCTRQTKGFGKDYEQFQELGASVYGISADSPKAQTTFKNKLDLPFDLLSDTTYALLGPLGAKKSPKGVIRSHWVFNNGVLEFVQHQFKPDASPSTCLVEVQALEKEPEESEEPEEEEPEEEEDQDEEDQDEVDQDNKNDQNGDQNGDKGDHNGDNGEEVRVTELKGEPEKGIEIDSQLPVVQSPEPAVKEPESKESKDGPNVEEVAASNLVTSPTAEPTVKEPTEEPESLEEPTFEEPEE